MVNDLSRAIETKDGLTLLQELKELENSLCLHFANEEKIAQAVNFPYAQLKSAQQCSLNALQHLMNEIETEYGMWPEDTSHFLETWVIEHIIQVDMPMKPLLQERDYNFWPGYIAQHAARTETAAGQQAGARVENSAGATFIRLPSCSQHPLPQSPEAKQA